MNWFFIDTYTNYDIFISMSPTMRDGSCFDPYAEDGGPNPKFGILPDKLYCFIDNKNAFKDQKLGNRVFIRLLSNIYMVSENVFNVIENLNINYEKVYVEFVENNNYINKEKYYVIKVCDVYENTLDSEKSGIKYGYNNGNRYISSVDNFVFFNGIKSDLFIPMDSLYFQLLVCSQEFKDKLEKIGITDVRFSPVEDFVAVHDRVLSFPEALEIIPRPRSADYYFERRLKKKGKK